MGLSLLQPWATARLPIDPRAVASFRELSDATKPVGCDCLKVAVLAFAVLIDLAQGLPQEPKTRAALARIASFMKISEAEALAIFALAAPDRHAEAVQLAHRPEGAQDVASGDVHAEVPGKLLRLLYEMLHKGHAGQSAGLCNPQPEGAAAMAAVGA